MGFLRDLEKRLENAVEGFFARTLPGGGVQPVELGKRMVRAMDEHKTVSVSNTYAPNSFVFRLAPKDHARLEAVADALAEELAAIVRRAAEGERWTLLGPPEIRLEADARHKAGTFGVSAAVVESDEPEPDAGPRTRLVRMSAAADAELLVLGRQGRSWPISKDSVVVGRDEGCDVVLADASVSRRHAEIRREGDEWVLIDLSSTNGTLVNGRRVNRHRLSVGDRIAIGETGLEFRKP